MMYAILYKVTKKGTGNMGCRIMPTSILTTTERANFEILEKLRRRPQKSMGGLSEVGQRL